MYKHLGTIVSRGWVLVILAWIALAVGMRYLAPSWDSVTHDGDLAYLPANMTSVRGAALQAEVFAGNRAKSQFVIVLARNEGPLTQNDLVLAESLAERFAPAGDHGLPILAVTSPGTEVLGKKLVSEDHQAALVVLASTDEFMATANIRALATLNAILDEARHAPDFPPGLELGVSGSAAIGGDMLASAKESIDNTELATVVILIVILLAVYRAPLLVIIPLTTIAISVAVALGVVALLTQAHQLAWLSWLDFKVFKTTRIFIIVILFGSGTDFCLFLIARYKEELERGLAKSDAVAAALSHVGEAIVGSALTTIFGLGTMVFADFGKFRNSGPAIALCLAVVLVACLTLAPAMLRAAGGWVFWPFGVRVRPRNSTDDDTIGGPSEATDSRFWQWVSHQIIARPGLILIASVALLSPLAYAGLSVPISYDLLGELDANRSSVRGTRMLRGHFPPGEIGPITVLAFKEGADFESRDGKKLIGDLTESLYKIDPDAIKSVRSLTQPLGDPPQYHSILTMRGLRKQTVREHPLARATYVGQSGDLAGQVTRLDVISKYDPFSPAAADLLTRIDIELDALSKSPESPWYGADFNYVGTTAGTRDLKEVTTSDQWLIQQLVVIAVYAILLIILRRPLVCGYLILSVVFSYLVTIGATKLVFAWLYPGFDGLDWKVPLFLFVILIAVGEDYNIYLLTRVVEEQRRYGLVEGLRVAVVRTGGIITSCGVIMAGTFISMMTGTLRGMLELGFALSLGVMLDTVVVRPVLVPAFLALLYRLSPGRQDNLPISPPRDEAEPAAEAYAGERLT